MLILASTSPYRRELLSRLGVEFDVMSPDIDETPQSDENARDLAVRLAYDKAHAVAQRYNQGIIIGSDQTAALQQNDGSVITLGKPGTEKEALRQLKACSGKTVRFYTGLCVIDCEQDKCLEHLDIIDVTFRHLSDAQIDYYIATEKPLDCAGSFKSEGLGIALFAAIQGRDPNALIGLPLIALTELLAECGLDVLNPTR